MLLAPQPLSAPPTCSPDDTSSKSHLARRHAWCKHTAVLVVILALQSRSFQFTLSVQVGITLSFFFLGRREHKQTTVIIRVVEWFVFQASLTWDISVSAHTHTEMKQTGITNELICLFSSSSSSLFLSIAAVVLFSKFVRQERKKVGLFLERIFRLTTWCVRFFIFFSFVSLGRY